MADDLREVAGEWLVKGDEDLETVRILLAAQGPAGPAGAHVQQAVEKYLKAFLIFHGWKLVKTHDLQKLIADAAAFDPSLKEYDDLCEQVTEFYAGPRYPLSTDELTREEVARSFEQIQPLLARLRAAIPE